MTNGTVDLDSAEPLKRCSRRVLVGGRPLEDAAEECDQQVVDRFNHAGSGSPDRVHEAIVADLLEPTRPELPIGTGADPVRARPPLTSDMLDEQRSSMRTVLKREVE